jgi:hypothetical protein
MASSAPTTATAAAKAASTEAAAAAATDTNGASASATTAHSNRATAATAHSDRATAAAATYANATAVTTTYADCAALLLSAAERATLVATSAHAVGPTTDAVALNALSRHGLTLLLTELRARITPPLPELRCGITPLLREIPPVAATVAMEIAAYISSPVPAATMIKTRMVARQIPTVPTIDAAPAEATAPGEAAAIPAGPVPAIEIEAIAPAVPDHDLRVIDNRERFSRAREPAAAGQGERLSRRRNANGHDRCRRDKECPHVSTSVDTFHEGTWDSDECSVRRDLCASGETFARPLVDPLALCDAVSVFPMGASLWSRLVRGDCGRPEP